MKSYLYVVAALLGITLIALIYTFMLSVPPEPPSESTPTPYPTPPASSLKTCQAISGYICSQTAIEACPGHWLQASDTTRCCSEPCVLQPLCAPDPTTGRKTLCRCQPNLSKNKVAFILKRGGIYDTPEIAEAINLYFGSVSRDLSIGNAGIVKFEGSTVEQLDKLIEELYIQKDVGYVLLLGDDLPLFTEDKNIRIDALSSLLPYVDRPAGERTCKDLAISWILPPLYLYKEYKPDAVRELIERYTSYHNDPAFHFKQYSYRVLELRNDQSILQHDTAPERRFGYRFSADRVLNSDHNAVREALKKRYLVLVLNVPGKDDTLAMGLNYYNFDANSEKAMLTFTEEYARFVQENDAGPMFVDSYTSNALTPAYMTKRYCCWPQVFIDVGAWAYYWIQTSSVKDRYRVEAEISRAKTIGKAFRSTVYGQAVIFGDVLAHFPS